MKQTSEWKRIGVFNEVLLPETCPIDHEWLKPYKATVASFPYNHVDLVLVCPECDRQFLFGIPADPIAGNSLTIYDTRPNYLLVNVQEYIQEQKLFPPCPWHRRMMELSKVFGNKVYEGPIRIQFKCPQCFYIEHYMVE